MINVAHICGMVAGGVGGWLAGFKGWGIVLGMLGGWILGLLGMALLGWILTRNEKP